MRSVNRLWVLYVAIMFFSIVLQPSPAQEKKSSVPSKTEEGAVRTTAGSSRRNPVTLRTIRYFTDENVQSIGNFSGAKIAEACNSWSEAIGIDFQRTDRASDADVEIKMEKLNGPGPPYALADVGPPTGARMLELRLDSEDHWTPDVLEHVVAHEIGHLLGLGHTNTPRQLMDALFQPDIKSPQSEDISRAKAIWDGAARDGRPEPATLGVPEVAKIIGAQQERERERERDIRKENVSLAQWLGPAVLLFTLLIVLIEAGIMVLRGQQWEDGTFKLIGLTLIVNAGVFLTVSIVDRELMSPMFGLMGALAGYILGRDASVTVVRSVQTPSQPSPPTTG
jgi:Matrixin